MTKSLILAGAVLACCFAPALSTAAAENAPSLEPLQGKWSVTKTNGEGRVYSMLLDIKKDKLVFELRDASNEVRMAGKGTMKTEKAGPFQLLHLTSIEAGRSLDDVQPVDEERSVVYQLRDGHLFLASNFDRERRNEKPGTDEYVPVEARAQAGPAAGGSEAKLLGTWKLEVTTGDSTRDYELRISKPEGKLTAVLISPRSGEHPCKSVEFKDGQLVVEVEREYDGNQAVFVYKAKFDGEDLTGTVAAKGSEDQFSGKVKGTK